MKTPEPIVGFLVTVLLVSAVKFPPLSGTDVINGGGEVDVPEGEDETGGLDDSDGVEGSDDSDGSEGSEGVDGVDGSSKVVSPIPFDGAISPVRTRSNKLWTVTVCCV